MKTNTKSKQTPNQNKTKQIKLTPRLYLRRAKPADQTKADFSSLGQERKTTRNSKDVVAGDTTVQTGKHPKQPRGNKTKL